MRRPTWIAVAVLGLAPCLTHAQSPGADPLDAGRAAARAGHYDSAMTLLSHVRRRDSSWIAAQRELARVLSTVGRYDDAERVARGGGPELSATLGELLYARGRAADADSAWRRAIAEHASDSLTARADLAAMQYEHGARDQALRQFDSFIDVYNKAGGQLSASELMAVGTACRYLGDRDPQLFKDALKAFDQASAADPEALEPRLRTAELFLEKDNGADAASQLDEILKVNPSEPEALLDAAERAAFDGQPGTDSLLARALAVNPEYVDALVFRAQLSVGLEDYPAAQRDAEHALRVNPASLPALAVLVATRYLQGDQPGFVDATRRSLAIDSTGALLYNTLAEMTADVRRYQQAADFARRAVARDPRNWRGYGILGMNELRLGDIPAGRADLEKSFGGDPYNVWIKNTLDLLDTYKDYAETRTGHFLFVIGRSESDLLGIYLGDLAERAYGTFQARYGYTPAPPIRIEIYRSHADFSVRTVGLAGLGALGVSFGTTLAFDSPAAKDAGPFNWGSTVWHELAHTFTLGLSDHRVPRWLSEGLSVWEEHHGVPGWGFQATPAFLNAFKVGKLVPVSRMNDGFMHPTYPEQVQFSYYEASLVCDLIAAHWGDTTLVKMLRAYSSGLTTDEVFQRVLGERGAAFDQRFDAYLRARFATPLANVDRFTERLAQGQKLFEAKQYDAAAPALQEAQRLFPEYGGDDSPSWLLAQIDASRGDRRGAADELGRMLRVNESNYAAYLQDAALLDTLGDAAGAASSLERALYVNPFDMPVHERLAALYEKLGDHQKLVRERRAVVALAPVDVAQAYYRLALAYHEAGDSAAARRAVLRSLEQAPNYAEAQRLLLVLHGLEPEASRQSP